MKGKKLVQYVGQQLVVSFVMVAFWMTASHLTTGVLPWLKRVALAVIYAPEEP